MRSPTKDEWLRLEPVLDDAVALPRDAARALLQSSCGNDHELLDWASRFLDGASSESFPVSLTPDVVASAMAFGAAPEPEVDARFGAYRIVRELGRGGMGAVYLADRADGQYEQRAALKLVQRGLGAKDTRERFLRERQILARLDHPNVAHLLDGGITDDGQPWFAMEYVDGEPLDAWCDRRVATVDTRLTLFLAVCDAVQAAHQRLVIHRDLKPPNILVTADGQVKLLDFGIAKLLQDTDAGSTRTGLRAFTPAYAAPEQWRGEPVTTGSDVYSLGAILYELLAGVRPHDLHGQPETEWPAIVLQRPIAAPSAAVTPQAAAARGVSRDRLRRRLRDDLDVIVLTALRTEPDRRYRTVDQFAADIRRHLAGLPIGARPDTWRYRTRKFVKRNRLGAGAAALLLLSLVGGSAGIAWQARRAGREAARANASRAFLAGMFRESDPAHARGDSLTAGDMLDRATGRLDSAFAGQPDVKLDLMFALGDIYLTLGRLASADSLLSRAVPLADSVDGDRAEARALAALHLGAARLGAGDYVSADTLVRRALAEYERLSPGDSSLATILGMLGTVQHRTYRFSASESTYRRALAAAERSGFDTLALAAIWNDFGVMLMDAGRFFAADTAMRRTMDLESHRLNANDPGHALTLMNYALVRDQLGDKDSAAAITRQVLRIQQHNYPNGHERVAMALNHLAFLYMDMGDFAGSDSLFRAAGNMLQRLYGPDYLLTLISRNNTGRAALLAGDAVGAERMFRGVLADARRVLGESHGFVSQPVHWIGRALLAQGRPREARGMLDSALHMAQRTLPAEHERFADVNTALGATDLALGDTTAADRALVFALRHRVEHAGERSVEATEPMLLLARLRAIEGRRAAAESLYVRTLSTLESRPYLAWKSRPARREFDQWRARWGTQR